MFEEVLSDLRDAIIVIRPGGDIFYANRAAIELFTLGPVGFLNKQLLEVIRLPELADLLEEARAFKRPHEAEIKFYAPAERTLLVSVDPIRSGSGHDIGSGVVFRDITEMKRLENLRSEFVANVSHELKTPLTAIRGYAETLLNGALTDAEHNTEFVQKIEKHAANLGVLIDDLLEISQLEGRRGLGDFAPVAVGEVVGRVRETLADKAARKKVELTVTCADRELSVSGIEDQIYRAVLNLADNALNYTDPGGRVTISCARRADGTELSVSDTGIGIAPEHLPRLFERFYRVDKARSRDLGGTGLGLAIVKHVMNLHGGQALVESREGRGSKFTLVFPA